MSSNGDVVDTLQGAVGVQETWNAVLVYTAHCWQRARGRLEAVDWRETRDVELDHKERGIDYGKLASSFRCLVHKASDRLDRADHLEYLASAEARETNDRLDMVLASSVHWASWGETGRWEDHAFDHLEGLEDHQVVPQGEALPRTLRDSFSGLHPAESGPS